MSTQLALECVIVGSVMSVPLWCVSYLAMRRLFLSIVQARLTIQDEELAALDRIRTVVAIASARRAIEGVMADQSLLSLYPQDVQDLVQVAHACSPDLDVTPRPRKRNNR